MTSPDERLEQRARALYRQAAQELDPALAGRLRAARRDALQPAPPARRAARLILPAGAFAAVALAALMAWPTHRGTPVQVAPSVVRSALAQEDSDLPPDADSADPTLYQNLDFYGWLAANDTSAPAQR